MRMVRRLVRSYAVMVPSFLGWCQAIKMPAVLQPGEQEERRQACGPINREKPSPAGPRGDETRPGRQVSAAERGQRGEKRILRRRMQRIAAQRRQVSDEDHGADGAGEILGDDGESEPRRVVTDDG